MLRHSIKMAFRNFLRHKGSFGINIIGLATGLACALLIFLWVYDELQMDQFHEKNDRLYRVLEHQQYKDGIMTTWSTPGLLAQTLAEEIPEVEYGATIMWPMKQTLSVEDKNIKVNVYHAGEDFFRMFSFNLFAGKEADVLKEPSAIVISRSTAEKLFDSPEEALDKTIEFEHSKFLKVTGVFEDVSKYSSLKFDVVTSYTEFMQDNDWLRSWNSNSPPTFITLKQGSDPEAVDKKIANFVKDRAENSNVTLFLKPFGESYLYGRYENGKLSGGRIEYVRLFSIIAIFILVIACINFMNLSTAGATRRSKEIGVKKVLGSRKNQLVQQFLVESFISTIVAMALGILLVVAVLPIFNQLSGKGFEIGFLLSPKTIGLLIVLALSIGLLAGSYPAFFLSSIKPIAAMKNKLPGTGKSHGIRSTLVVVQFVISSTLILAIIIVSQQMYYIQNKNIGYSRDHRIVLRESYLLGNNESVFKEQLLSDPRIENVTVSAFVPAGPTDNNMTSVWTDKNPEGFRRTIVYRIDENYIPTMGMELMAGRNFYKNTGGGQDKVIVNEALVRALAIEGDPIGQTITRRTDNDGGTGTLTIVGVIRDFHFRSLHEPIAPLMMVNDPYGGLIIKANTTDMAGLIQSINAKWQSFDIGEPFTYALLDELYNETYLSEQKMGGILRVFGLVTIFVACLGLFGLVTFTAEQRVKEIGIRKVLGASVAQIVSMLSKDLLRPVALSFVIAFPVGFYFMDKWLQGFAYRIEVQWWVFLVAGVGTLWVAFFTLSFKTVRAALANPVQSLRTE
ncbi:MAG: ABC transporter permease [Saprospiraceae bacterium]|nr:ABC transporter permease [Saprospiraceae bacterium]